MAKKFHGHNQETLNRTGWQVKEPVIKTPANKSFELGQRVDFDLGQFDKLITQKGTDVCVYRTAYCPRVKSVDAAEHEIDCTLCSGSGFVDLYPIQTQAFLQNQDLEKQVHLEGYVDGNHITASFPIGIELQYYTLVELEDYTEIYFQRVLRNASGDIDVLQYKACRVNFLMDYNGVLYVVDVDFKLDLEGNVEWIAGGRKPADNLPYTIHYEARTQFRAVRAMHVNRFTQVAIGEKVEHIKLYEQWLLAKEFLVRRKAEDGTELFQGPWDNHTIVT